MLKRIEVTKNKGAIVNLIRFSLLLLGLSMALQGYIFEYLFNTNEKFQNIPKVLVVSDPKAWLYTGIGIFALSLILFLVFKTKKSNFLRPLVLSLINFWFLYELFYYITPKTGRFNKLDLEEALNIAENSSLIITSIFLGVFLLGGIFKNKEKIKNTFVNYILISTIILLNLFFLTGTFNNYVNSDNHFRLMGYHNVFFGSLRKDCSPNRIIYHKYNLYPIVEECYFSRYLEKKLPTQSEEYILKMIYGNFSAFTNFGTMAYHIKDMNKETAIKIFQIWYEGYQKSLKNKNHTDTEIRKTLIKSFEKCYEESKELSSEEYFINVKNMGICSLVEGWVSDAGTNGYHETAISIERMEELQKIVYTSGISTLYQIEKDSPDYKVLNLSTAIAYSLQNLYGIYLFIRH